MVLSERIYADDIDQLVDRPARRIAELRAGRSRSRVGRIHSKFVPSDLTPHIKHGPARDQDLWRLDNLVLPTRIVVRSLARWMLRHVMVYRR